LHLCVSDGFLKKETVTGTRIDYLAIMPTRRNANIQTYAIIPVAIIILSITLLVTSEIFVESEFVCIFLYSPFKKCRFRFCITSFLEKQIALLNFSKKGNRYFINSKRNANSCLKLVLAAKKVFTRAKNRSKYIKYLNDIS